MNKDQVTRAHQARIANCIQLAQLIEALAKANAPDPTEVHAAHLEWESADQCVRARAITTGGWKEDWRKATGELSLTGWAFEVFRREPEHSARKVREADRYFEAAVSRADGDSVLARVCTAFVETMTEHGIAGGAVPPGGDVPAGSAP